ncbi:MAG: pyridoxal-phosphate dependent enzyme [Deltaproteobacteria bacterium]|nr:pyridoxal-phosphate dependent enzyme [Deltaproteobacteria bacterium]
MAERYDSILETIGHTPVVRINKLAPPGVELFAKVESFNPMGSVKDRLALGVIEAAEKSGELAPGQTVIEATSGNTGIGLAMVCAQKGYPLVVTMAESFSVERRKIMRFLGAKVVLTPASEKGSGMLAKAVELAEAHGWFLTRQFENEANADIHSQTTAPEILDAFADVGLDYWVTGFGTGGTLKGVARVLKERSPDTKIVVCEPDNSAIMGSGIEQVRAADGSPAVSHPSFRPHLMQGWTPDFIPKLAEDARGQKFVDQLVMVSGVDALQCTQDLASKEGIFAGITAGATLAGALEVCRSAPEGSRVLCMLPDTGERYLTTPLFEDVPAEMTGEEIEISQSTPRFRFDVASSAPPPAAASEAPAVSDEVESFVSEVIADTQQPVLMFALEWCEFCWSVRKMFAQCKIPYRSVDLDSVEYQEDDRGGQIRAAVSARTSFTTIPQIFVGGEFLGGCTDIFDAFKEGRLQELLQRSGVAFDEDVQLDPYDLLPVWLHPR